MGLNYHSMEVLKHKLTTHNGTALKSFGWKICQSNGSVHTINIGTITVTGIYTVKLVPNTTTVLHHQVTGIELIAQDTTSTANRSKIQIPSQNVVSFGKKFTVSGTPHYDPFTTMSYGGSGTTLSALQSLIDTDTSLGMDALESRNIKLSQTLEWWESY